MEDSLQKLYLSDGNYIAYHKLEGKQNYPAIIFLAGFMSDMQGIKAISLENFCKSKGFSFIRFDYFGHGQSSKKFIDCTIAHWQKNILDIIDKLTIGKQILVGSSMGGWLMLLATLARKERIAGLVGIASAPDFTEDLIWEKMTQKQQNELLEKGLFNLASDFSDCAYPITKQLIFESREYLLLRSSNNEEARGNLSDITCPVRLIHGKKDQDVPCLFSTKLATKLINADVQVNLVENGDHRMSTSENIALLCDTVDKLVGCIASGG